MRVCKMFTLYGGPKWEVGGAKRGEQSRFNGARGPLPLFKNPVYALDVDYQ